jgi:hypothetical protein
MTEDALRLAGPALALTCTVSTQPALVETVRALAARVGEHAGCSGDEARRLGEAVARALDGIIQHTPGPERPERLDIRFQGNGNVLLVEVACDATAPAGFSLEQALAGDDLAALRARVDRVEFGDREGCPYCRLICRLHDSR